MPVQRITTTVNLVSPSGATVTTLKPLSVVFSADEGTSPQTTARVTVAMPTALQYAMMKPGAGYFLSIRADSANLDSGPLLLKITDRSGTLDRVVELEAASAEIDLQSFTPSAKDVSNWQRQGSVPAIITAVCNAAFGTAGWARYTFGTGAVGEDVGTPTYPTFSAVTNLIPNGGFEYGTTGWVAQQSTVTASTVQRRTGVNSLSIVPSSTLNTSRATIPLSLQPGTTYTLSGWIRQSGVMSGASSVARTIRLSVNVSAVVQDLVTSTPAPNVAGVWSRVAVTFTMPALADAGSATLQLLNGTSTNAPTTVWWDDVMVVEGNGLDTDGVTPIAAFDGDTVDGTAGYNYDWQGTPGNSSSSRTPIISRDPESLTWSPGQSAWDFLQPILQAVGLRLWSKQYAILNGRVVAQVFYARNEFGLTGPAQRVLDTVNLFEITQVDSFSAEFPDGTPMYADQVAIRYSWTDSTGEHREAFDVYPATGRKTYFLELEDTPFAGAGRAQGIYKRISARATILQGSTWFNRAIEVGAQISVSAASLFGSTVAYVEAATFDPFRGTTEFRTKQTVAFTSTSWFAAAGSWAAQTGSWASDT